MSKIHKSIHAPVYDIVSKCPLCKHFKSDWTCAAYPKGIPVVFISKNIHHEFVTDDQKGNFTFEAKK